MRTIYLPQETIDLLLQEHAKHPGNPIMFPSPVTGRLYGPDCIGRLHKTLLKKAGITENVPFNGLRHTFATLAIQQGMDAKTVSLFSENVAVQRVSSLALNFCSIQREKACRSACTRF